MQPHKPTEAISSEEMRRIALIHIQAYLSACQCQSRTDVLHALTQWQDTGADLANFIRHTRIIFIH